MATKLSDFWNYMSVNSCLRFERERCVSLISRVHAPIKHKRSASARSWLSISI
jgi:hypothetical protein